MGDRIERVVAAIKKLFADLGMDVREERVIRYLVEELRKGRAFDDVMQDPYVINNTREGDRERLVENPLTLKSIEEEIATEFRDYQPTS
jgi:hypothetical protein